jgi:RNA polymerase sigma factor (sigma-70 family)
MSSADARRNRLRSRVSNDGQQADVPLVGRLRSGDAEAFAEVVRAWSPMMLQAARSYVSTDASAQEVVQEAWLAMIRGLDKFEGRSSLRTWLLGILANIGRSRGVREARTLPLSSLSLDEGPAVDPDRFRGPDDKWPRNWTPLGKPRPWSSSPEEQIMAAESRTQLEHGLAELPVVRHKLDDLLTMDPHTRPTLLVVHVPITGSPAAKLSSRRPLSRERPRCSSTRWLPALRPSRLDTSSEDRP